MLYLASQSPRRRQLLEQLGYLFSTVDVGVEEARLPDEPPEAYVRRVAREKGGAGLLKVMSLPDATVLSADTEVVLGQRVFGKPANAGEATAMLHELSGRTHEVLTSVWLLTAGAEQQKLSRSTVTVAPLNERVIAEYVATGECFGKAGGYAIQGRAAAFIARIDGSHSGVMGLPLHETWQLLAEHPRLARSQPAADGERV